jgi:hypothetical protein
MGEAKDKQERSFHVLNQNHPCRALPCRERGRGVRLAAKRVAAKRVQARPNKSKQKRLDLFGLIRPNRDFSMGYGHSK